MAERFRVARLGAAGDGIADGQAESIHIPYALPGETVLAEPAGRRAGLVEIVEASPARIDPFCPYYTRCGGCVFQHLEPEGYVTWKREKVASALARAGLDGPVAPLADAHGRGRRRMILHTRRVDGEIRAGFMAAGTHDLVPIDHCPITVPALHPAPGIAERLAREVFSLDKPIDVAVTASPDGLDIDLRGSGPPGDRRRQALIGLAETLDLARLSVHGDVLIERRPPGFGIGLASVVPPSGAFLQATEEGEERLAALVLAGLDRPRRVLDLFAGVGPFTLRIAESAEVHAVEGQQAMLAALDRGARHAAGLRRVTTESRDLFRRPLLPPELDRFDALVIDPPRQGAEAQIRQVIPSSLDRVIMASCDPVTFARDAAALVTGGFVLEGVWPVDQFKWSAHVEIVGRFRRSRRRPIRRR